VIVVPLVRGGTDQYLLPRGATKDTAQEAVRWYKGVQHNAETVFGEMMVVCMVEYNSMPDVRTLTLGELVYLYEGRRRALRKATKPS
jgi:hypothetical protein